MEVYQAQTRAERERERLRHLLHPNELCCLSYNCIVESSENIDSAILPLHFFVDPPIFSFPPANSTSAFESSIWILNLISGSCKFVIVRISSCFDRLCSAFWESAFLPEFEGLSLEFNELTNGRLRRRLWKASVDILRFRKCHLCRRLVRSWGS